MTLRSASQLERLKNGVEMGPGDLIAPLTTPSPIVRLLGPEGDWWAWQSRAKRRVFSTAGWSWDS